MAASLMKAASKINSNDQWATRLSRKKLSNRCSSKRTTMPRTTPALSPSLSFNRWKETHASVVLPSTNKRLALAKTITVRPTQEKKSRWSVVASLTSTSVLAMWTARKLSGTLACSKSSQVSTWDLSRALSRRASWLSPASRTSLTLPARRTRSATSTSNTSTCNCTTSLRKMLRSTSVSQIDSLMRRWTVAARSWSTQSRARVDAPPSYWHTSSPMRESNSARDSSFSDSTSVKLSPTRVSCSSSLSMTWSYFRPTSDRLFSLKTELKKYAMFQMIAQSNIGIIIKKIVCLRSRNRCYDRIMIGLGSGHLGKY